MAQSLNITNKIEQRGSVFGNSFGWGALYTPLGVQHIFGFSEVFPRFGVLVLIWFRFLGLFGFFHFCGSSSEFQSPPPSTYITSLLGGTKRREASEARL